MFKATCNYWAVRNAAPLCSLLKMDFDKLLQKKADKCDGLTPRPSHSGCLLQLKLDTGYTSHHTKIADTTYMYLVIFTLSPAVVYCTEMSG